MKYNSKKCRELLPFERMRLETKEFELKATQCSILLSCNWLLHVTLGFYNCILASFICIYYSGSDIGDCNCKDN